MSVLIKDMEMPDKCGHCRFASAFDCAVTGSFISTHSIRQPNCPLVPVPEHGDLIDRDKLEKDIDKYIGGEESRSRFHHWVQVQYAVIPMDKGEEK